MEKYFSITVTQNCRKYVKLCYQLTKKIDDRLLDRFQQYGVVEVSSFSRYLSTAKDTFRISLEEEWSLSGVVDDTIIHLALARASNMSMKQIVEGEIVDWMDAY